MVSFLCAEENSHSSIKDGQLNSWVDSAKHGLKRAANYIIGPDNEESPDINENGKVSAEDLQEKARSGFDEAEQFASMCECPSALSVY
jgi:transcription elongation factor GreA-like protein